jgi:peptidoglycan/xylan/chitin deacetylase (PgdA/CDA1 family)
MLGAARAVMKTKRVIPHFRVSPFLRRLPIPSKLSVFSRLARRLRSRSIAIVMYHGVVRQPPPVFDWCQLDETRFEEEIAFLSQQYSVIPLAEAVDRLSRGLPLPQRAVALTFDDGFRNVYTTAHPILERYRVPATVFLVTSLIEMRQPPWPERLLNALLTSCRAAVRFNGKEWPLSTGQQRATVYQTLSARLKAMEVGEKEAKLAELHQALGGQSQVAPDSPLATMNWDEIERLARTGLISFGSHTHTHQILSRCSLERQREELRISRDILREHLGSADLFAYPNGSWTDFTEDTKSLLVELGYRCGLATVPGLNSAGADLYELRRVPVGADTSFSQFEISMLGW